MAQKENIKIALLGIIALTLIVNTYYDITETEVTDSKTAVATKANNSPITPPTQPEFEINNNKPEVPAGPTTSIQFTEEIHDFGTVKQDSENQHIFKFKNTGNEPLIISNARGSCGCTVPRYPKDPIPPGGTGEIEVTYKPGKQKGNQTKTVTVTANTEPSNTVVKITANVEEV